MFTHFDNKYLILENKIFGFSGQSNLTDFSDLVMQYEGCITIEMFLLLECMYINENVKFKKTNSRSSLQALFYLTDLVELFISKGYCIAINFTSALINCIIYVLHVKFCFEFKLESIITLEQ